MKRFVLLLFIAAIATGQASPPQPNRFKSVKRQTLSAEKPTFKVVQAPATPGVDCKRVLVAVAQTDGIHATNTSSATALMFTAPNPSKNACSIAVSDNLNSWQVIRTGVSADPVVLYDFMHLTQRQIFYKFSFDTSP